MAADLSNLEKRVLLALGEADGETTPDALLASGGFDELVEVMNAASWLQSKGLLNIEEHLDVSVSLGPGGEDAHARGLPERRALRALAEAGGELAVGDLVATGAVDGEEVPIAIGWLKRKGLAEISRGDAGTVLALTDAGREALDARLPDEAVLARLHDGNEVPEEELDVEGLRVLYGRQDLVRKHETMRRDLQLTTKGRKVLDQGLELQASVAQITPELVRSGAWRDVTLRRYDVSAYAPTPAGGKKNPLRAVIDRIRRIFLDMGFTEIEGPFVRSAFWNMDALFIPQDHPARAMQDTFYLGEPATVALEDDELVAGIRGVHETGGDTGSRGWRYDWSREEAERALLRTHTTVDTVQYVHEHPNEPCKIFSVDRVFRSETLDATHLPEFHQIEGVVTEPHANFQMLVGLFREFYGKLGFDDVRIRPGYFPYTEPSLEVEVDYAGTTMELGGAGIFRPEVTEPLGHDWPVLAWGLGLERLAMMMLGLEDIRDLYISDVQWLRDAEIP